MLGGGRPEPGAQLLGILMAQIFEESQGLFPSIPGGAIVAGRGLSPRS
jgi:hypothetical protein